jgi:hypothetical protein
MPEVPPVMRMVLPVICMGVSLMDCGRVGELVRQANERERGSNLDCSALDESGGMDGRTESLNPACRLKHRITM